MQTLLENFVPAADEVWGLQHGEDPASRLFQKIAEQGHYAGRTVPTDTRQGIYATAPNGILLASINTRSAEQVSAMLERALAKWNEMTPGERMLPDEEAARIVETPGWERLYPEDGLVLRVVARDLPRPKRLEDWRDQAWNQDFAWLRHEEMMSLVPRDREVGATARLDETVARRFGALQFTDFVRGQVPAFDRRDVHEAWVESRVVSVDGGRVTLELTGKTSAIARGTWAVAGFDDMNDPKVRERGVELKLLGRATFDAPAGRFVDFEIVAMGRRWGGTQYNGRDGDLEPAGIGFDVTLVDDGTRVPPASIWAYGWN